MERESLYTPEISAIFHSLRWPKNFKVQIVQRKAADDLFLQFIIFRDNFESFDGVDKNQIALMVKEFMEKVRKMGVPIYMEVAKGDGRAETNRVRLDD